MSEQSRKHKRADEVEVNPLAPGQRFKNAGTQTGNTTSFGGSKSFWASMKKESEKKVCSHCGKKYRVSNRLFMINGKLGCVHDEKRMARGPKSATDKAIANMQGRLKPNEVAVKGNDGTVRIYG